LQRKLNRKRIAHRKFVKRSTVRKSTSSNEKDVSVKLMTIGDGAVGKTSLLMSFALDKFPDEYSPTVFDNYNCTMIFQDHTVALGLWDTAGQQDYETLRPLAYPGTHIFLVCFSVISRSSFINVEQVWLKEIQKNSPDVPWVLCGTKGDLLENPEVLKKLEEEKQPPILKEEAEKFSKKLGAYGYVQCSGKTQVGMTNVFQMCVEAGLIKQGIISPQKKKKMKYNLQQQQKIIRK